MTSLNVPLPFSASLPRLNNFVSNAGKKLVRLLLKVSIVFCSVAGINFLNIESEINCHGLSAYRSTICATLRPPVAIESISRLNFSLAFLPIFFKYALISNAPLSANTLFGCAYSLVSSLGEMPSRISIKRSFISPILERICALASDTTEVITFMLLFIISKVAELVVIRFCIAAIDWECCLTDILRRSRALLLSLLIIASVAVPTALMVASVRFASESSWACAILTSASTLGSTSISPQSPFSSKPSISNPPKSSNNASTPEPNSVRSRSAS